jgi:ribonuclease P protein subunit RPR2
MAKKGKDEAPNPHSVSNRDIIQRLNFLYQAGVYLNTISSGSGSGVPHQDATPSSTSGGQCTKPNKKRKVQRKATTSDLAKAYISSMKVVGQKTTVKLFVVCTTQ